MHEDIHWKKFTTRFKTFPALIESREPAPGMIICIPVMAEPDLISTLSSLCECTLPDIPVEVILLFNTNHSITDEQKAIHEQTWLEVLDWVEHHQHQDLRFFPVSADPLPDKRGGVGWARKLAMDEAARRLVQSGIILCLDADCTVSRNYLQAVYDFFLVHPSCDAASIYFEHRLEDMDSRTRHSISQYEMHLRYLVHALRWTGHPFAYQTVGSAMAVRRKAYLEQGGMNTRQAGEDFYFLQKFIEVGSLYEIRSTVVFPSARISHRVPFGTGRAMKQLLSESDTWMSTSFVVFKEIRPLFSGIDKLRSIISSGSPANVLERLKKELGLSSALIDYLSSSDFPEQCQSIADHTTSVSSFRQRFFRYFNAFHMIRYMHYMADHFYPDVPIADAIVELSKEQDLPAAENQGIEAYLDLYRKLDQMVIADEAG